MYIIYSIFFQHLNGYSYYLLKLTENKYTSVNELCADSMSQIYNTHNYYIMNISQKMSIIKNDNLLMKTLYKINIIWKRVYPTYNQTFYE